ncbi:hypothetical protein ACHAWF_012899, partial [Thalassiosira exigua]
SGRPRAFRSAAAAAARRGGPRFGPRCRPRPPVVASRAPSSSRAVAPFVDGRSAGILERGFHRGERFYSCTSILRDDGERRRQEQQEQSRPHPQRPHHAPRSERHRRKLHVGFASLSDALPFEPSPDERDLVGDAALDPRATVMLAALRGGVRGFDVPAPLSVLRPPTDEAAASAGAAGTACWDANRSGEGQILKALDQARKTLKEEDDEEARAALGVVGKVVLIARLGYRAAVALSPEEARDASDGMGEECDGREREGVFPDDARVGLLRPGTPAADADEDEGTGTGSPAVALVHNLSEAYATHALQTSPLARRFELGEGGDPGRDGVEVISLAHNPETQVAAYLQACQGPSDDGSVGSALLQEAREHMKRCLTSAFVGYERAVKKGWIDGYGVDSNGLSLPREHEMHLDWRDVLECAAEAYKQASRDGDADGRGEPPERASLRTIRLPGNLLETRGLTVAAEIRSFFEDGRSVTEGRLRELRRLLPKSVEVHVTRPLTAYPHGGTGRSPVPAPGLADDGGSSLLSGGRSGTSKGAVDATRPVRLLDYEIEAASAEREPVPIWSNLHRLRYGPRPLAYQPILNAALSHFDAESILEASRARELTTEERETLDGCKLLRDLIHDLDAGLDEIDSLAAHEEYLADVVAPVMYGSFEELDEESAGMLRLYFRAHGMAARMVVARKTRELLVAGGRDGTGSDEGGAGRDEASAAARAALGFDDVEGRGGYDVPAEVPLQEYALERLLGDDAVRGLVVGCSRPEHVLEAMRAADSSGDNSS